jgi:hypothetical protein
MAILGVVILAAGVATAGALGGDDGAPERTVKSTSTSTSTSSSSTATTVDRAAADRAAAAAVTEADEEYRTFVARIENLLEQSANGRQEVISVVTGVQNCTIPPNLASQRIRSVVANRQSVLNQVSAMVLTDNAEANGLTVLLQKALQESIEANRHYQDWMDHLYTTYYNASPVGCPDGHAPQNAAFQAASGASVRATAAKQAFAAAYNPVATRFDARTWQHTQF